MCTVGGVPTAARCWPGKKCNKYSSTSVRGGSFLTLTSYRPLHTSRQIAVQRRLPSCSYVCACVLTCVHQKKKMGEGEKEREPVRVINTTQHRSQLCQAVTTTTIIIHPSPEPPPQSRFALTLFLQVLPTKPCAPPQPPLHPPPNNTTSTTTTTTTTASVNPISYLKLAARRVAAQL